MRIGRPFGIPVFISPYWFVIAGLFVFLYARGLVESSVPGSLRYPVAAAFVVLLYASVLVHELSHSLVARGFGLPVRRILLYPLGGFSEIEQEPPTPGREFLVSAAGPAISLALAAGGYALSRAVPDGSVPWVLFRQLFIANLLVGVFNLLPGLPLDGGRMLRAGVWKVTGRAAQATVVAAWAGRVLAVAVLVVPLALAARSGSTPQLFDVAWLAVIAAFMWSGAGGPRGQADRHRERDRGDGHPAAAPAVDRGRLTGAHDRPGPGAAGRPVGHGPDRCGTPDAGERVFAGRADGAGVRRARDRRP